MVVQSYVRAPLILFSHSHFCSVTHFVYVSMHPSFCSVIYILSRRSELCLLGSIAFLATLLYNVDARLMGYKLEQFQSPRMHSSVTTGNGNTIKKTSQLPIGTGYKIVVTNMPLPYKWKLLCKQRNMSWLWWCAVQLQPAQSATGTECDVTPLHVAVWKRHNKMAAT